MAVLHANRVKEAENIHWNDVYKLPLRADYHGSYAWTPDDTMALDFDFDVDMKVREEIIAIINGEKESDTKGRWYVGNAIDFFLDGLYVFCVRGWGHLTGTGAMHLPEESADRIQDEFVKYIFSRLN
ncbi:MAG: hypothetical protein IJ882_02235 [Paludibacteraceae bacterium]|nr:hypothetical protein [Paludibacteraceae bacterium]